MTRPGLRLRTPMERIGCALTVALALGAGAVLAGAGCNTYDPDLGATPFRCGPDEPRCPDGYACVVYTDQQLCEKIGDLGADAGPPDADIFSCADDHEVEPNNDTEHATDTFIPGEQDSYTLVALSVCPSSDQDYFKFQSDVAGKSVVATMTYRSSRGALLLDILDQNGTSLVSGEASEENPDMVRAEYPTLTVGTYYVRVGASGSDENNYSLDVSVTAL